MHASCSFVDYVTRKGPRSCVGMFRMLVNLVNLRQQRAWIMAVSHNGNTYVANISFLGGHPTIFTMSTTDRHC